MKRRPPRSTLFPNTTLFRSGSKWTPAFAGVTEGESVAEAAHPLATRGLNPPAGGWRPSTGALPSDRRGRRARRGRGASRAWGGGSRDSRARPRSAARNRGRSEEHTSELQLRQYLVCRLLLEKKKKK